MLCQDLWRLVINFQYLICLQRHIGYYKTIQKKEGLGGEEREKESTK